MTSARRDHRAHRATRATGRVVAALWVLLLAAGCSTVIENQPRNLPAVAGVPGTSVSPPRDIVTSHAIGLSFSGGGLRAAAFAHGVLLHLQEGNGGDVLDDVTFISSVSGGSLTAAWFGLHGRDGLRNFEPQVLLRDFEASMRLNPWALENVLRALSGGVNDRSNLGHTLDREVFHGATFAELYRRGRPDIWINATDLFNRTPFPFIPPLFATLCSDLAQLPLAEAVQASMSVPLVFAPVVLRIHAERCADAPRVQGAIEERVRTSPLLAAAASAVRNYRNPAVMRYVKLVDGGVTDNAGLSSILIARAVSDAPYGPLTTRDAVRVQHMLFVIVDAGRGPVGQWTLNSGGPNGLEVAMAATDSAIDSAARVSVEAFHGAITRWQGDVVRFRCGLTPAERAQLGLAPDWRCDDVTFEVTRVSAIDLTPERAAEFNAIPTRLTLTAELIRKSIEAGRDAAASDALLQRYKTRHGR
jgi:NTE family protein